MLRRVKNGTWTERTAASPPAPYLYIYYISGRVPAGCKEAFGSSFIGNWQEGETSFLFFSEPAADQVATLLADQPHLELNDHFEMSYEQWHGGPILPLRAGRLLVMPPWAEVPAGPGEIPVLLDPGVVFGAGNHPTTRHCLLALQWLTAREAVASAIDLGAGTGLLSIAAAGLGVHKTLAVDNNFLAAATALRNIRLNGLDKRVLSVSGRAEAFVDSPVDLLMANIHFDIMRELIEKPGFKQKKWFVLSGLMRTQAGRIKERIIECGAEILNEWIQDGSWYTICGKNC